MALLTFHDDGSIEKALCFGPKEETVGFDLPYGIWHTVICLEEGSVFYETKPGPFNPINKKDMAPWAPEEGTPEADSYLQKLVSKIVLF
jgi:cupin fold WbuC family metalloprotein